MRSGDRLSTGARTLALLALLVLAACGDDDDGGVEPTRSPTATPRPTSIPTTPVIGANWLARPVEVDTLEVGLGGRDFLIDLFL